MSEDDRDGRPDLGPSDVWDNDPSAQRRQTPMAVVTAADFERLGQPIDSASAAGEPTTPAVTAMSPAAGDAADAGTGADAAPPAGQPEASDRAPTPAKSDLQLRVIARAIDVAIFALLAESVAFVGPLAALVYLLLADALFEGASVGKRLTRLRVVRSRDRKPANVFDSLLRNAPLGIAGLFVLIPLVGWALFLTLGLAILLFEGYLVWTDGRGVRAGDILAGTQVIEMRRQIAGER
ncbi:MAG: RDD family protein [Deltaproteobacteria bacterium]|nr:RDD family protein [Deltaproteobacteria bacterium]